MKKIAIFAFVGDPMCFAHVLYNALDMYGKKYDVKIVIEGAATKLLPGLGKKQAPLSKEWKKVKDAGLVAGVCRVCSSQMGTAKSATEQGLALLEDMTGHPSISQFRDQEYEILIF